MPKVPITTAIATVNLEGEVEEAVAEEIEGMVPPEFKGQASSMLKAVLREAERRPLTSMIAAMAAGYVVAIILKK